MVSLHLPGNDLLSQDPSVQVSSALEVLTSVFGMGTGGTPPVSSPDLRAFSQNYTESFNVKSLFPPTLNCERCHTDVASVAPTWMVIGSDPLLE